MKQEPKLIKSMLGLLNLAEHGPFNIIHSKKAELFQLIATFE